MRPFVIVRLLLVALALSACVRGTAPAPAEQSVRAFMAGVFDRPEAPLRVPSVALVGDFAVAGWIQSGHGGRTLLKRSAEGWEFVVCGGGRCGGRGVALRRPRRRAETAFAENGRVGQANLSN